MERSSAADFFLTEVSPSYDAIIGNPPWKGRTGQVTTAQTWARTKGYPDPAKDMPGASSGRH